jgi:hypothetical protein
MRVHNVTFTTLCRRFGVLWCVTQREFGQLKIQNLTFTKLNGVNLKSTGVPLTNRNMCVCRASL